ncbi:hypothetical protein ABTX35_01470 [Streptomyces sp. NPDC096080]|uniref:hypothetical protein n=1 Tax=Streptomyces sp. NPDC096080 TaxID=3156693 RepID=UPI00331C27EF
MTEPGAKRVRAGAVAKATRTELDDLGVSPDANASAAAAMRLAKIMDSSVDPKEVAASARELRQAMHVVRAMAPPKDRGDIVDELASRRPRHSA